MNFVIGQCINASQEIIPGGGAGEGGLCGFLLIVLSFTNVCMADLSRVQIVKAIAIT